MKLKAVAALEELIETVTELQQFQDETIDILRGRRVGMCHGEVVLDPSKYPEGGPYNNLKFWQGWKQGWAEQNFRNQAVFYRAVIAGRVPNDASMVKIVRTETSSPESYFADGWEIEGEPHSEGYYSLVRCELKP